MKREHIAVLQHELQRIQELSAEIATLQLEVAQQTLEDAVDERNEQLGKSPEAEWVPPSSDANAGSSSAGDVGPVFGNRYSALRPGSQPFSKIVRRGGRRYWYCSPGCDLSCGSGRRPAPRSQKHSLLRHFRTSRFQHLFKWFRQQHH